MYERVRTCVGVSVPACLFFLIYARVCEFENGCVWQVAAFMSKSGWPYIIVDLFRRHPPFLFARNDGELLLALIGSLCFPQISSSSTILCYGGVVSTTFGRPLV